MGPAALDINGFRASQGRRFSARARRLRLAHDPREEIEIRGISAVQGPAGFLRTRFDAAQDDGRIALEGAPAALRQILEPRLHLLLQTLRGQGVRLVFVDDASMRGFVRGGLCGRRIGDVAIPRALKTLAPILAERPGQQEKKLRLALGQA